MQILLSTGAAAKTHTLGETEAMALSLGYAGLELMPPPLHQPLGESKRDTNFASLTQVPVMHAIGDVYDQPRFRAALDTSINIAQEVKIPMVNIHPASLAFGGRQNVIDGVEYIKQLQAQTGIIIAYEILVDPNGVHPSRQAWFKQQQAYTSIEAWLDDVLEYDLAATLDTCHVGTWHSDPAEFIEPLADHLVHVHFSDFDQIEHREHILPGTGQVPLQKFLQVLQVKRSDITLTVEIDPVNEKNLVEERARQSIQYIQQTLANG